MEGNGLRNAQIFMTAVGCVLAAISFVTVLLTGRPSNPQVNDSQQLLVAVALLALAVFMLALGALAGVIRHGR